MASNRKAMVPNAEQWRVIRELDRNILLLASAGTGKTGTLAQRIAHILATQSADPSEVLCLTFTNKGSREIQKAVEAVVGAAARGITMGTFHSFCLSILQEEGKRSDRFYTEMVVHDEDECHDIVADIIQQRGGLLTQQTMPPLHLLSYLKEERILGGFQTGEDAIDYQQTVAACMADSVKRNKLFSLLPNRKGVTQYLYEQAMPLEVPAILTEYQRRLAENHGVDFTDLILGVYTLFQDPAARQRWAERYRYICIDEVQDTSELEFSVLRPLLEHSRVLLCGDFFQTIYEWRGSMPNKLLTTYRQDFDPETIVFYDNYRANQTLFEVGFSMLEQVFPELIDTFYQRRPACAAADAGDRVEVLECSSTHVEVEQIFRRIRKKYHEAYVAKQEPPSVAVLVRTNRDAMQISQGLERLNQRLPMEQRLRFLLVDQFKFFRRREVKDVLAFLKYVLNPQDSTSAKRIMSHFVPQVGPAMLEKLESEAVRRTGLRLADFLNWDYMVREPYEDLLEAYEAENIIVFDVESTGVDTTSDEIIQMAAIKINREGEAVTLFERFIKPTKSVGSSELVHGFSDEYLAEHGEDPVTVLQDFLAFSKDAIVVGHNVNYDVSILSSELMRHNLGFPQFRGIYDTLELYRRFHPNEKNHKLETLSHRFATKHKPSHNAVDDILATGELLVRAIREDIVPTMDARRLYLQERKVFSEMASRLATLRRMSYKERPTALLTYILLTIGLKEYYENEGVRELVKREAHLTDGERRFLRTRRQENNMRIEHLRRLYRIFEELEHEALGEFQHKGIEDFGFKMPPDRYTYEFSDEGMRITSRSMRDLLQRMLHRASLTANEMDPRMHAKGLIPIVTVHQSKGSEFDHVFLACCAKGHFPHAYSVKDGRDEEEKRLFYVALTRPRQTLTISYAPDRAGIPAREAASPYLAYLPYRLLERVRYE